MSEKRFYWLKLQKDFFKRHDIKYIQTLPDGYLIAFFYLKLMVESVDHDGELRFSPEIPYTEAMLASVTDTPIEIVTEGLKTLKDLGMVIIDENGTISIPKVIKMIGSASDTDGARRMRRLRDERKANSNEQSVRKNEQMRTNDNESKSKSKSKSKNKSKSDNYFLSPIEEKKFVKPSVEEVYQYCEERHNNINAQLFVDYYTARGWKDIDDWKALIRTWENNNLGKEVI